MWKLSIPIFLLFKSQKRNFIAFWTIVCIFAPFVGSFVLNCVDGRKKNSLVHLPIVQAFVKISWLNELRKKWYTVDVLNAKVSGMHLKDLRSDDLQKLNKAKSRQIRLEIQVVESKHYEIILQSAPQALLQISTIFSTGVFTTWMLLCKYLPYTPH